MSTALNELFTKHKATIDESVSAVHNRHFYAHWPEPPSGKIYGETAQADGEAAFKAFLNNKFEGLGEGDLWYGTEESPYGFALNITYPSVQPETLVQRASTAFKPWAKCTPAQRAGILTEALERSAQNFFAVAFATMHTTGQGFVMSFQASGPHAYDRGLEAIGLGYFEQTRFPEHVEWEKPMGKFSVKLDKGYRAIGRGVSLVVGCSTFPVWNSLPSVMASLVTGNPVIVKPHPKAILPMAILVRDIRATLEEHGIDPNTIQLGVDGETLMTKELAEHPSVKLIDYTGSTSFGNYLEKIEGKIVFTEKAGVNSVILDSVQDLDPVLENLAFSLSLYSGQMCTTPQNIFIPKAGIRVGGDTMGYEEVVEKLKEKITGLVNHPKMGAGTLGAIQNKATLERVESVDTMGCDIKLVSGDVAQPGFEQARSISPTLVEIPAEKNDLLYKEMFGPIAFIVPTESTKQSIEMASDITSQSGAITFAAYTTDESVAEQIEDALAFAGVPVSFNLTGPIWVNQSATFSDFHVTGGNPAGNASLVDPAFIVRRFFVIGTRKPTQ